MSSNPICLGVISGDDGHPGFMYAQFREDGTLRIFSHTGARVIEEVRLTRAHLNALEQFLIADLAKREGVSGSGGV